MTPTDITAVFVSGLLLGGLYGFMSYGLGLIYGVMRVVNLAHGALLVLGAYGSLWLFEQFQLDPLLSLAVTAPAGFFLGVAIETTLVRRLRDGPAISSLLLLFGVWLVLKNVVYLLFGGDDRSILTRYTFERWTLDSLGVTIGVTRLAVFLLSAAGFVVLHALLRHTHLGRAIRAVAQDRDAAALAGVDVDRVSALTFGLGSALAASAGSLMALIYSFNPEFGSSFLLKSFCVVVIGRLESTAGVFVGGIVLGLAESLTVLFLPASLQDLVSFVVLVTVLVLRPPRSVGGTL